MTFAIFVLFYNVLCLIFHAIQNSSTSDTFALKLLYLNVLQPESYSYHSWCESAFTFAKNITLYNKNQQASSCQMRKSNTKVM